VQKPRRFERDPFFKGLAEAMSAREQKDIVIFIHGFNNTFDDAVSRLGVLAYDMQFNGVPVLYSWCSRGGTWGVKAYPSDEERVAKTIRPLAGFLARVSEVGREAGARRINVVAHSMGNRALVGAFQILAAQEKGKALFDETVMAAPDVPATGFATQEWPHMQGPSKRLTHYASADDKALIASKNVHDFRRLGEGGEGILLLPGLDTIDASGCDFSLLGLNHSYFGGKKVLSDLRELIERGLSPLERKLREQKLGSLPCWLLPDVVP
jgi:esterase/lipase superfamily enzyme